MALQVWLPLTKDLRNQGLNEATVSNNGATYSATGGKLGGCYNFNNNYCAVDISLGATASIACWTKTSTDGKMSWVLEDDAYGYLNLFESSIYTLNAGDSNNNPFKTSSNTNITCLHDGQWHHFVVTFGNSVAKLYIDGDYRGTAQTFRNPTTTNKRIKIGGYYKNAHSYSWNGGINDFRVYDHCLSPMEVKQISQGLVLHYPLNSNSTYTSLVDKTASYTIYNNHGVTASLTKQSDFFRGAPIYRLSMTPTSDTLYSFRNGLHSHGVYGWRQTFAASTKYVFWIYYKPVTHMDVRVGGTASNISGWTEIPPEYVGNGWYRVGQYRNGTVTEAKTDNIFTSFCTPTAEAGVPIQIDFACPMLVQGLTEIQDSIGYSTGNVVYDSSGYCNNGTITGTLSNTLDTPKYAVSTKITPNSNIQFTPMLTGAYSWTIAAWIKPIVANNDGKAWFSVEQNTYWQITCYSNQLGIRDNSIGGTGTRKNYSFGTIAANTWVHLVATYDNGTLKLYNNGVLQNTNTVGGTYLNAMNNGRWGSAVQDGYYWNGQMSDARIYATALSASDVKSLYQNCATIDPDGTIRGQIRS